MRPDLRGLGGDFGGETVAFGSSALICLGVGNFNFRFDLNLAGERGGFVFTAGTCGEPRCVLDVLAGVAGTRYTRF